MIAFFWMRLVRHRAWCGAIPTSNGCVGQAELLEALWRVLAPDGKLLYATCSVFPEENGAQVDNFLVRHPEAEMLPLPGLAQNDKWTQRPLEGQILPSAHSDGFFYALLKKTTG